MAKYSVNGQQDFSYVCAAFHQMVGLGCLLERVSAVNVRSDRSIFEHWPDSVLNITGDPGFFIQALGSKGRAGDAESIHHDFPEVDFSRAPPKKSN